MATSFQRTRFRTVQAASSARPHLREHHPTQTPGRSERVNVHTSTGGTSPGAGAARGTHGHQQTMARRLPRPHLRGHGRSRSKRNPDPEWQDASSQAADSTAQVSHTRPLPAPREGRQRRVLEGPPLPPAQLRAPRRLHTWQGLRLPAPGRGRLVSVGRQQQERPAGPACTGPQRARPRQQVGPGNLRGVLSTPQ